MERKKKVPGRMHQYLLDNFSLPSPAEDMVCKNGHVLLIYLQHGNAAKKTIDAAKESLGVEITFNALNRLLNKSIRKFKNFPRDQPQFEFVCGEHFQFQSLPKPCATAPNPESSLSAEELRPLSFNTPETSTQCLPVPSLTPPRPMMTFDLPAEESMSTSRSLRADDVTPRKAKLRQRLHFVSSTKKEMKRKYRESLQQLRKKIHSKPYEHKVLKQALHRKDLSIMRLKDAIKTVKRKSGADKEQIEMKRLREKHQRLKEKRKNQRSEQKTWQTEKLKTLKSMKQLKSDNCSMKHQLSQLSNEVTMLENEKTALEDKVENLQTQVFQSKTDRKKYSVDTRMIVYDYLTHEVPTRSIPSLIKTTLNRCGLSIDNVPNRTTVEEMTRELGVIADLQAAEIAMENINLTLAFDATTQEGIHVNCVHFTTNSGCQVVAMDQLAGGTAEDYFNHISSSVDNLAATYAYVHGADFEECRRTIIQNISNTMTDRAAVNHATIMKLNEAWNKSLNELNCHLHPLDSIASSCRQALKSVEPEKGRVFGSDCMAANIVLAINKMRYKDGKGDPRGFLTFLRDHGLPSGVIPRYRGNRLHVLFHICEQLVMHYNLFVGFFSTAHVSCGGLRDSLRQDLTNPIAVQEICTLAIIGRLLSGPWMKLFYKSAQDQIDHVEGIGIVRDVRDELHNACKNPMLLLSTGKDFFKNEVPKDDPVMEGVKSLCATTDELFRDMLLQCLNAVIDVLSRQYEKYFTISNIEQLREQTTTARLHNIDAEEMVGMFSAAKQRAPHATMCYISAKLRGKKNGVVPYLDNLPEDKRKTIINWAVKRASRRRQQNRLKVEQLNQELSIRAAAKRQKQDEKERRKIEQLLQKTPNSELSSLFPQVGKKKLDDMLDLVNETAVGRNMCHLWYDSVTQEHVLYNGRIEKMKKKGAKGLCVVAYWGQKDSYEDAVDYNMSKFQLAADVICGDLMLS